MNHSFFKPALLIVVVLSLTAAGCSSIGGMWTDFNSYFNTFYNAKQSYDRGYRQFENQVDRINPERPIRIHRSPVRAGVSDFEDAIERGSDLLIRFPESRYVDDAVALIGRSFFFLENFFNAEQKFVELYTITASNDKRQQAVIWRARTMLELKRNNEGINYLFNQLDSPEIEWDRRPRAEAELIMAQFLVKTDQWEEAGQILFDALPEVRDNELRARGYFLHGQILEHLGEYQAAYDAYDRVRRSNPYYQMIYYSDLKKGILYRKMGRYEESRAHLASMARNNNNFEFLSEINFHRGRTHQAMNNPDEAIRFYREVLYFSYRTPSREVLAQTHYGMAEVYRFNLHDHDLAAAHYDSSARNTSDLERLPRGFDSRSVSRAYNEFARLNNERARKDSLLYLGNLPPAKFDSVITVIQEQYRREMRDQERQRRRDSGRIINVDPEDLEDATESTENGFLFHLNRQLMGQASLQFQALWDGRPLVDNWRRQDSVRRTIIEAEEDDDFEEEIIYVEEIEFDEYELDLSDVPRSRAARERMRKDLARTKYEIGNLYFLTLNQPDSAKTYFRSIIRDHEESEMVPQAMYSLSEIFYQDGDEDEAQVWAVQIADLHPDTPYARRLSERFNLGIHLNQLPLSEEERLEMEYYDLLSQIDSSPPYVMAEQFFEFGKQDTVTTYAPEALFNAARLWINTQKENEEFQENLADFRQTQRNWELARSELSTLQDSARVVLADTAALAEDDSLREYWSSIADSTIAEPEWHLIHPYTGENWDKAREALTMIKDIHPGFRHRARVDALMNEIRPPEEPEPEPEPVGFDPETGDPIYDDDDLIISADSVMVETGLGAAEILRTRPQMEPGGEPQNGALQTETEELEIDNSVVYEADEIRHQPVVTGGMEAFVDRSGIRERLEEMNVVEATFYFIIHVTPEGDVERATPIDEDEFGLNSLLREQIEQNMTLQPAVHEGKRVPVIYELAIQVN